MAEDAQISQKLFALVGRPDLPDDVRTIISAAIDELEKTPLRTDRVIYRSVVIVLGLCVLITVIGGIWLVYLGSGSDKIRLPDAVVAIGSAAIGALAGLLAPSSRKA